MTKIESTDPLFKIKGIGVLKNNAFLNVIFLVRANISSNQYVPNTKPI